MDWDAFGKSFITTFMICAFIFVVVGVWLSEHTRPEINLPF